MKRLLGNLSTGQILTILLVVGAVGTGLYYFTRWRRESDFRPLYANLEAEDAGAVVERLKQSGSAYRLSADGRTVMVPSAEVAELRLSLASEGVPRNGRIGYELFDKTNFGATEFAEQVNYRRALEGELERSVASLAAVEQARVHLTFPKDSVFLEARQPAKASVLVKLRPGHRLAPQNVSAISHLVSSAVENLAPEAVSVLDMQGNLFNRPRLAQSADGEPPSEATLAFRQAVERDLVAKIAMTLEPLVGADKFRASAAVECDFSSGEQSEESFDPARSVMLASQKTEESTGTASSAGVPGTASNLPRPTSQPASASGGVFRQTENITYQSSRTVRRVKLPQGTLKRMSVAVLVDHDRKWTQAGKTRKAVVEPPSPEKLKAIRDLVAGAVGLNTERGDQLIVESLPFESDPVLEETGEPAAPKAAPRTALPAWIEKLGGEKVLVLGGVGAGVLLLLVIAGAFWLARGKRQRVVINAPAALPPGEQAENPAAAANRVEAEPARSELPAGPPKKSDVVANRLRETIKKEPEVSAQILRGWLSDEER
ncbi:MAG: flagellar basal-body MS-ring/collar protein FliF [Bryobacteraceae bacterium]